MYRADGVPNYAIFHTDRHMQDMTRLNSRFIFPFTNKVWISASHMTQTTLTIHTQTPATCQHTKIVHTVPEYEL